MSRLGTVPVGDRGHPSGVDSRDRHVPVAPLGAAAAGVHLARC